MSSIDDLLKNPVVSRITRGPEFEFRSGQDFFLLCDIWWFRVGTRLGPWASKSACLVGSSVVLTLGSSPGRATIFLIPCDRNPIVNLIAFKVSKQPVGVPNICNYIRASFRFFFSFFFFLLFLILQSPLRPYIVSFLCKRMNAAILDLQMKNTDAFEYQRSKKYYFQSMK